MKTGIGDRTLTRASTGIALTAVLALPLVLSGCEDHSPVAAPTSTLPADEASQSPSPVDAEPTIPAYETDLDLSDEETEAVEGALLAFEGYIATINRVFSSGGKDSTRTDQFARDGSLKSLKSEAKSMRSEDQYMAGEYKVHDIQIESVELENRGAGRNAVSVLFCTRDSVWRVVDQGDDLPSSPPRGITMQHIVTKVDGNWKVANQYLRSKECENV